MNNKSNIANSLLYLLAFIGVLPAMIFLARWLMVGIPTDINEMMDVRYGPVIFAILFAIGVYLSLLLSEVKKLILLLPLLCMAVLPILSDADKDQIPSGAVVAFDNPAGCPKNWDPLIAAEGRTIIGAYFEIEDSTERKTNALTKRKLLEQGGAETHKLSIAEMPSHNHANGKYNRSLTTGVLTYKGQHGKDSRLPRLDASRSLRTQGGNKAHNNMQPFIALYYCKKR
jgi:hypothetical protein